MKTPDLILGHLYGRNGPPASDVARDIHAVLEARTQKRRQVTEKEMQSFIRDALRRLAKEDAPTWAKLIEETQQ